MPRSTKPQISFADWELLQQGIVLEPLLQNISDFLDDHEELIEPALRPRFLSAFGHVATLHCDTIFYKMGFA